MIKTLQKRFVRIAMTMVTLLIVVFAVAVNGVTIFFTDQYSKNLLDAVTRVKSASAESEEVASSVNGRKGIFPSVNVSDDDAMGARLFRVTIDKNGNPTSSETDRILSVDSIEAREYARKAVKSGKTNGRIDDFIYKRTDSTDDISTLTFLDISDSNQNIKQVMFFSAGIGLFSWLLMFLVVSLLSERAMKPVAENLEKQKQFITDAGHEIKTPLASIKANAEAMEMINGENKWTKNILSSTDKLSSLVQELLELSRNEENAETLEIESVNLSDLALKAVDSYTEYAISSGKTISAEIQPDIKVKSNAKHIEKILEILLENAIKYSAPEGRIKLILTREKHQNLIAVTNRVEKLPECEPEKLFDRFYRADSSRNSEGFGIGLSSARATATMLGGEIHAEYVGEDRIAFVLRLP